MASFLNNILTAHFAITFVAMLICLFGFGYPSYQARSGGGLLWLLWFLAGVICLIVCVKIAFNV